jgi:glycosyltransferase involved in cell wall biosynthesis
MKVSIVIPAHNAVATLRECLAACLNQTHPDCDVIVVDDGSTDATGSIAQTFPVKIIQQRHRGPAAARNAGARASDGAIIAFTDSDCIPHAGWVERLIGGLGGTAGAAGGTYGIANPKSLLARIIHEEIRARHAEFGEEVDFIGSYNLAVKRDVFDSLQGFDENFTAASGEDNDLSYRMHDAGYALRFVSTAVVDHHHPERLWPYLRAQMRHGYWRMKLYAKHPRRSGGDTYAGLAELACASFGFFAVLSILILPWPFYAGFPAGAALFIVLWRFLNACSLMLAARDSRMLFAWPVLLLRDTARGVGLARGIWHFLVLRKVTA